MSDYIDFTGIHIKTRAEILAELVDGTDTVLGFKGIYGSDINIGTNTPDGNVLQLFTQAAIDMREMLVSTYNSFDPDKAVGNELDRLCAINGIKRNAGSYTQVYVKVNTSASVTLYGLDQSIHPPFTVSDGGSNKFFLVNTATGTFSSEVLFRAEKIGSVQAPIGAINTLVTIQSGVTSVNQTQAPTTIGTDTESDFSLRIRRAKSVSNPGQGYLDGLYGGLYSVSGVDQVKVYENVTDSTDGRGVPPHGIWIIVSGGSDSDVGNAIYKHLNAGVHMTGSVSQAITNSYGSTVNIVFDRPSAQSLYITMQISATTGGSYDATYIRNQLIQNFTYIAGQDADVTAIVAYVKGISPYAVISSEGVSTDGVTYTSVVSPSAANKRFTLAANRIKINGATG